MTAADPRPALVAELSAVAAPHVTAAVFTALGADPADPARTCPPVAGWYVDVGDDLFGVVAVSAGRLVRFEMTRDGRTLTLCVPLRRVTRVVEAVEDGTVTVVVELDAERVVVRLDGATAPLDDGGGHAVRLEGELRPTAIVLTATGDRAGALSRFAAAARIALAT